jgi:hypothetical protein
MRTATILYVGRDRPSQVVFNSSVLKGFVPQMNNITLDKDMSMIRILGKNWRRFAKISENFAKA